MLYIVYFRRESAKLVLTQIRLRSCLEQQKQSATLHDCEKLLQNEKLMKAEYDCMVIPVLHQAGHWG